MARSGSEPERAVIGFNKIVAANKNTRALFIMDKVSGSWLLHLMPQKVSDGSQPPTALNLSLSESAGSHSLHRLC